MKHSLFIKELPGVRENATIVEHTTFGVGGRVRYFFEAPDSASLIRAVRAARRASVPYRVIAGGSNVVFSDKPFDGLIVKVIGGTVTADETHVSADAGAALADLITVSIAHGLSGLETLSGIPGSVGGAIAGNAGAYGHSISEPLVRLEIYDPEADETRFVASNDCAFSYRESIFKQKPWIILQAEFVLQTGLPADQAGECTLSERAAALSKISESIIETRSRKYKPEIRCPGSFFKNVLVVSLAPSVLEKIDRAKIIEGKIPAGYLLEEVGAKGMRQGDAAIADFHGNLLMNTGRATSADVRALAEAVKEKVKEKFGIELEEEVRYIE
jgi:UDP-N-acetylmuramate dehydrogenase